MKDMATPKKTPADTAATPGGSSSPAPAATAATRGPRNYLVTMLLAALATPTGLARAYRGEQIGWTRFWIFAGALVLSIIPFLNIVAFLALLALYVWGAIDVFQLYKTKTDADGVNLVVTPRDEQWARGFYIFFLVSLVLTGIAILFGIIFGAFIVNMLMNARNNPDFRNNLDSSQSQWLQDYNSQLR